MPPSSATSAASVGTEVEAEIARRDRRARHALWLALLLVVIWGANFTVQKAIFQALSPGGFLFLRYLVMPACAAVLLFWRFGLSWPKVSRGDALLLLRLGLIGHLLHVGLVTYGIHWSTAFSSSVILACGPIFTLFILHWHGHEKLTRGQVAGVAVACLGVIVFLSDKLFIERLGGVTVMTYAVLFGSLPVVVLSLPAGLAVSWGEVSLAVWAGTFYAVIVSAFLGWLVWGWVNAVRGVGPTAPLMYLMPPVAGLVAWALTGERYSAAKIAGAAITLAGVALAQFTSSPRDPVREAPAPVD